MGSHGKRKAISLLDSFSFAINGIRIALLTERNMRIHLFSSVIVIGSSIFFSISTIEWLIVLIVIGGMLALELVNTAIERVVDLVTEEFHPFAKQAKDMAAGAVFIYAIISVVIGMIVFWPHILKLLSF
ncbi:diacylglycerol kinase family protein [Neobacillus pocheonensis]|uniref:Diacylglycerol kinase family protein n=1 Tax=Neobacillus pocheonensis TaxID=363869 RepID=A0ABT0W5I9_9BACI|nr:diacylglycerol kinase family protein [Neobacillus pocheonensis]